MADSNELVQNIRYVLYEVDLLNSVIVDATTLLELPTGKKINQPIKILPDIMGRFKTDVVGPTFHTDTVDELEHVVFYSDDTALIQRRKFKYDFATDSSTSVQYIFNGATTAQIIELRDKIKNLIEASAVVRNQQIKDKIQKISDEKLFYDATMNKRMNERKLMLKASDWRVLEDVEDSYPNEKAMWKKWRKQLRELDIFTKGYDDELSFFKALKNMMWPIDPALYRIAFPDGTIDTYLTQDEHWAKRDIDASKDFVNDRMEAIVEWRDRTSTVKRIVAQEIQDLMKLMRVEDFVENGIDYSSFYDEADLNDMAAE